MTHEHFHTITSNPKGDDAAGRIEEGWYKVKGKKVILTDASGVPIGEERKIERHALFTARQMLRARLMRRRPGLERTIIYPKVGLA